MRRQIAKIILAIGLLTAFVAPHATHAAPNDSIIKNFTADYTISNTDKQGTLHVVETIEIQFLYTNSNHGILRALPNDYNGTSLQLRNVSVTSLSGAPSGYTTYSSNGNTVLKIGDKDKFVTGSQHYTITYDVSNVINFYDNHDEFYWDINGTEWELPFEKVKATIHLPAQLELSSNQPVCFTGSENSKNSDCTVATSADNNGLKTYTFETSKSLMSGENMSVVMGFNKGYFARPTTTEKLKDLLPSLLKVVLPPLIFGGYAIMRWRKLGRDAKGRGVVVPQYDPPKGMTPTEVGTLLDFSTSQSDITAMMIDLAVRGYLIIHEETIERKLRKDITEYSIELANNDTTNLKNYERTMLEGLFKSTNFEKGSTVKLSALKNEFYTTVAKITKDVKKSVIDGGYFKGDPASSGGRLWALVILLFASCFFIGPKLGAALIIGIVLALLMVVACALAMPARTAAGTEALEHAKGLKMYVSMAEADRIKMMQSPSSPYASDANEPKRTVKLFEKLLPYAMIFGVEKEWAKQFEDMYKTAPDWYTGNMNTFSAVYLASSLSGTGFGSAVQSSFASPSSSGSSGSGGGGFSGGGGGGGGGGSW